MRILHTADWHLGKVLMGRDRTPEIAAALDALIGLVRSERIELVVAAGDLFDHPRPPTEAEAVFFSFLLRLKELGVPFLAVAGNHDSRARFDALGPILSLTGADVAGALRLAEEGGVRRMPWGRVAMLPFVSERRLVRSQHLVELDAGQRMGRYAELVDRVMANLASGFVPGGLNLMIAHLTIEGAHLKLGGGEFKFYVGNAYAVKPDALPLTASYVALGHIHRQQPVSEAPRAWYSGSLVQLDFGEGEDAPRGALVVELEPGGVTRVHPVVARWGKPLKTFRFPLEALERRMGEVETFPGYAKLVIEGRGDPALRERILKENPHVLEVHFQTQAEAVEGEAPASVQGPAWDQAYVDYHRQLYGEEPDDALQAAFLEIYEEAHASDQA